MRPAYFNCPNHAPQGSQPSRCLGLFADFSGRRYMCLKDSGGKGLGLKVQDLWFTAWLKATRISSGSSIARFSNDESCSWQELRKSQSASECEFAVHLQSNTSDSITVTETKQRLCPCVELGASTQPISVQKRSCSAHASLPGVRYWGFGWRASRNIGLRRIA